MTVFLSIIGIFFGILFFWFFLRFNKKPKNLDVFSMYFGSPGCGKTTFLVSDAKKLSKMGYDVYTNIPLSFTKIYDRSYIGKYEFPEDSVLLFDEGSLNGFDNRDYKNNFKDQKSLAYLKMLRHYKNKMIIYNQGWDELDKKLRTLCMQIWYVKKIGPLSIATLIKKKVEINKETHEIVDGYYKPSVLNLLLSRSCTRIIFRPIYYKYFDSYVKMDLGLEPYPAPDEQ